MDDIGRFAESVRSAQNGNERIVNMLESKLLDLNVDKTNFLLMGNKTQCKKLKAQIEKNPLTINGHPMKEVVCLKYLGDSLCSTVEESIHQTVIKRIGIAKKAVFEVRAVIEDKRSNKIGGFNVALEIWDAAIVPMLLNNCESWLSIPKKTLKVLDDLFNIFYRSLFRIGSGCPKANLYWQCGTLTVDNIILQKKLLFLFHLANLPRDSLAYEVFSIQETQGLFSLLTENEEHLSKLQFHASRQMSKWHFKKLVRDYIHKRQRETLLNTIKSYKKISYEQYLKEDFKRKQYFFELDLNQIRDRFRISSGMIDVKANFPKKYNYKLDCESCSELNKQTDTQTVTPTESQSHLIETCPAFDDLREEHDTETDIGLVNFFKAVMERRAETVDT